MAFIFIDDKLKAYTFTSDFANDSSDFDEGKISLIKKNQTTETEAIQLLGPQYGLAVYPLIRDREDHVVRYYYNSIGAGQTEAKQLDLLVDSQKIVKDYKFASASNPLPQAGGASNADSDIYSERQIAQFIRRHRNRRRRVGHYAGSILPGFIRFCGSIDRFSSFISSTASPCSLCMNFIL